MKKTKKTAKRQSAPRAQKHEIVVRVQSADTQMQSLRESDLEPEKEGSKYMIPKTWVSEKQALKIIQKTPPQHIYQRKGKGGQVWDYVTGTYVQKVLNFTFGWNWDFEIISHGKEGDQVWVQGKLTVKDNKGHTITKSQFGRADIKFKKDTKIMLDYGNDLKAASTDALKKCASMLGIASDIYGKMEYREAGYEVQPDRPTAPPAAQLPSPKTVSKQEEKIEDYVCAGATKSGCGNDITKQEADYSKKIFGKQLCRNCQKIVKESQK